MSGPTRITLDEGETQEISNTDGSNVFSASNEDGELFIRPLTGSVQADGDSSVTIS